MKKRTFLIIIIVIMLFLIIKVGSVLLNMLEISFDKDNQKPYKEPEDISVYPVYESFTYTGEGLTAVTNAEKKLGFVDEKNNVIIPFEYEHYIYSCFSEGLAPVKKDGKTGYINKNNEVVISYEYDYAEPFRDDCAIVKNNEKYGLINKKSNIIIPIKYNNITTFAAPKGYYFITENEKKGLINFKGDIVVPIIYDELANYYDTASTEKYLIAKKEDKNGVIDLNGNILLPFEYDSISVGSDACVCVEKHGEYAVISLDGKIVLPYGDKGYQAVGNGIIRKGGIFDRDFTSIYNEKGEKIFDEKNIKAGIACSNGTIVVVSSGENVKLGLMDFNGKFITGLKYDSILPLDSNHFKVERNEKTGILKSDGTDTLFRYKLKDISIDDDGNILAIDRTEKYVYVMSESGKILRCFEGENIYTLNSSYIIEKEGFKCVIVPK